MERQRDKQRKTERSGKDTNLDLIRPASATDALIRLRGNMLFRNTSSYLKPLLLNFYKRDLGHKSVSSRDQAAESFFSETLFIDY